MYQIDIVFGDIFNLSLTLTHLGIPRGIVPSRCQEEAHSIGLCKTLPAGSDSQTSYGGKVRCLQLNSEWAHDLNQKRRLLFLPTACILCQKKTPTLTDSIHLLNRTQHHFLSLTLKKLSLINCAFGNCRLGNLWASIDLPVEHKAMNVWECFLITLQLSWSGQIRDKICSRKSCGVTADKSHFNLLRTNNSISWKINKEHSWIS